MGWKACIVLATISVLASLAGCGGLGLEPCGGADAGASNAQYAGTYTATLHVPDQPDLSFSLDISESGNIGGSVVETGTARTATVTGNLVDWFHPCSPNETIVELDFTFSGESRRQLLASRPQGQVQPWPFAAGYFLGTPLIKNGTLQLSKTP